MVTKRLPDNSSIVLGPLVLAEVAVVLVCLMNVTRYDAERGCCDGQFGGGCTRAAGRNGRFLIACVEPGKRSIRNRANPPTNRTFLTRITRNGAPAITGRET